MAPEDRKTLMVVVLFVGGGFLVGVVLLFVFIANGL